MNFLKRLFGSKSDTKHDARKRASAKSEIAKADAERKKRLHAVVNRHTQKAAKPAEAKEQKPQPSKPATRKKQAKTRLIALERSEPQVIDLISNRKQAAKDTKNQFPVGWLVVIGGPGQGRFFPLHSGLMQIGRGEDQQISLDFGDTTISRNNHASLVFDADSNQFFLGHGGKSNIVRLNQKPVLSDVILQDRDEIIVGETVLKIKMLAGAEFSWAETGNNKERKHVESA